MTENPNCVEGGGIEPIICIHGFIVNYGYWIKSSIVYTELKLQKLRICFFNKISNVYTHDCNLIMNIFQLSNVCSQM